MKVPFKNKIYPINAVSKYLTSIYPYQSILIFLSLPPLMILSFDKTLFILSILSVTVAALEDEPIIGVAGDSMNAVLEVC